MDKKMKCKMKEERPKTDKIKEAMMKMEKPMKSNKPMSKGKK